jgi:lipoyl-dependent peroxiredoxin
LGCEFRERFNQRRKTMAIRTADAEWKGNLRQGAGHMRFGGGAFDGRYNFGSRFEEGPGTNPEELIAAAHAGCFSMALSGDLERAGYKPESVSTVAKVHIEPVSGAPTINRIELTTTAKVSGIDNAAFQKIAEGTKANCPVSRALKAVEVSLTATLKP